MPATSIPLLQGTHFFAFGDSLTQGDNGCNTYTEPCVQYVDTGYDYPAVLQGLLAARYTAQAQELKVDNQGTGGETAVDGVGRLPMKLPTPCPDALLLMEGVNDLDPHADETPDNVIAALRADIHTAKGCGVRQVFLSTLPPEVFGCPIAPPGSAGCRDWGIDPVDSLTPTNNGIRQLATQEQIVLVDAYQALLPNVAANIGYDGLHLTRAGRAALAQAFFAVIQSHFEMAPTSMQRTVLPASSIGIQQKRYGR